ncbi:insulinase family protein [Pseudomaricurvus sp.]|uniref:insulinase family protein n=1 Tax=Pseudomaricurvus sp. TaxID=2004510 RepID=UPI003F6B92CC
MFRAVLGVWFLLLIVIPGTSWGQPVIKSPNDNRDYKYLTLPNQLRVLLISDPTTDKASAALDVNVGSGDDPRDREGLAHFLEHMLFLGTEKYPASDEYQAYITSHGGGHNAYTASDHTNYFFDIDQSYLEPALDRFAQFFIAPLFTEEYVDRERNAVHSEYKSKIKNGYRRQLDVLRQLTNPRHPMSKFSVGNLDTLSNEPEDPVREDLLQFYQDHYSASNMTLVVLGRETVDQLEAMVTKRFSQVPEREIKASISGQTLFDDNFLPARVSILPVKDERRLTMMFPIPSADKYYREKPLQYLGNLLGHEGEGSLLSLLKDLGWAEGLSAGGGMGGRNEGTFNISISLTPEGLKNQDKIVGTTFRVIQSIRDSGVEEWRYSEQKTLADMAFRFAEKSEPINVTSRLAGQMHLYSAEDVIRGSYAFDEYNPRLIRRYLKLLKPDNFLWVVTAPDVEAEKVSPMYSTPYSLEKLRYEVASMPKAELDKLHLPEKNRFIPRHLTVKTLPAMEKVSSLPQRIKHNEAIDVWFKQDDQFRIPKASIDIRTYAPLVGQSAKNAAMGHLFAALVNDSLNEITYPASLAGLGFNVRANSRGFDLSLEGYNDRQGALLNKILNVMDRGRFNDERFANLKQELIRSWRNQVSLTPYQQLFQKLPALMFSPLWDDQEMADALENVTSMELRQFAEALWQGSHSQVLIYGNFYSQEALKLATIVEYKLHDAPEDDESVKLPPAKVVKLPQAAQSYHLTVDHHDVAAILYTQAQGKSVEDRASMMMVQQMLQSSFFNELRTEKQLGYIVFLTSMVLKDVSGNVFVVQSPSAPLDVVVQEIQGFVDAQAGSVSDFEDHRQSILADLREAPKNLQQQAGRYWNEIVTNSPEFDRRQKLIDAVEKLTPESVASYSQSVLGQPKALWLTAGATAVEVPAATPVDDMDAFKRNSESYRFP